MTEHDQFGLRVKGLSDVIHKRDCKYLLSGESEIVVGIFPTDRPCSRCRPDLPR